MKSPQNIEDLQLLIKNEVQESIHLDYKASLALNKSKRHEIAQYDANTPIEPKNNLSKLGQPN